MLSLTNYNSAIGNKRETGLNYALPWSVQQ